MILERDNESLSTERVNEFADVLRTLVPYFDAAGITWKDEEQYDNFDRIADVLFRELVLHPLTYKSLGEEKSYQYDMPPYEATWGGLWVVDASSGSDLGPLVRVASRNTPMDVVQYLHGSAERSRPIADVRFKLKLRSHNQSPP